MRRSVRKVVASCDRGCSNTARRTDWRKWIRHPVTNQCVKMRKEYRTRNPRTKKAKNKNIKNYTEKNIFRMIVWPNTLDACEIASFSDVKLMYFILYFPATSLVIEFIEEKGKLFKISKTFF